MWLCLLGYPVFRPTDTANGAEFLICVLGIAECAAFFDATTTKALVEAIRPDDQSGAHYSVRLLFESRDSMPAQVRVAHVIVPPLAADIQTREASYLPGGELAEMKDEQKQRIQTAPLTNDRQEAPFGMFDEFQRQAPNESPELSADRTVARLNKPFDYIRSRPVDEKRAIWRNARKRTREKEAEQQDKRQKLMHEKVEKMKEVIEAGEEKERKHNELLAKYRVFEPINTTEELHDLLADIECKEDRELILKEQIRMWNTKGVADKMSLRGGEKALKKTLIAHLEALEAKIMSADDNVQAAKKQKTAPKRKSAKAKGNVSSKKTSTKAKPTTSQSRNKKKATKKSIKK
jgi:hypothetical protein